MEMGNVLGTSSIPPIESHQNQQRQNDLDMLGQRVSFGDDELVHLYDAYRRFWQEREREIRSDETALRNSSFLYDWCKAILFKDRNSAGSFGSDVPVLRATSTLADTSLEAVSPIENEIPDSTKEKMKKEELKLQSVDFVIHHILPPNFDIALYKGCFSPLDDQIQWFYCFNDCPAFDTTEENPNALRTRFEEKDALSSHTIAAMYVDDMIVTTEIGEVTEATSEEMSRLHQTGQFTSNIFTLVDEYTRKTRLCTFFEALSCCCGRRSSKECIASLFRTVCLLQHHAESKSNVLPSINQNRRVSAQLFVETGYRFALALAYMQQCCEGIFDSSVHLEQFLPYFHENDACCASIHAIAQSIVKKRHRRLNQQRSDCSYSVDASSNENALDDDDFIELDDVVEWIDVVAPMFPYIVPTFFQYIMFPKKDTLPKSRTLFDVPIMNWKLERTANSGILSSKVNVLSVRNFALACFSPALNGSYFPLYSSNDDGLSFNRLQNAILGYSGPTLFIIQSESGGIFGAYTATAWKESKDFYGNTDCFLYQLWPRTVLYRPTSTERNFMYCNSNARSHGYDQRAHGIGFGGTVHSPRLFLAENFDDCSASSQDLTFENGPLLPDVGTSGHTLDSTSNASVPQHSVQRHRSLFALECLEVWGVGGSMDVVQAALSARESNRAQVADLIRKARKVDKAQFLDDFRSGTISSKAFAHRQQVDGRADADLDERLKDKDNVYNCS